MVEFQIPKSNEDPSDEFIEFINECPQDWDGDDSGITIHVGPEEKDWVLGNPGDWVIKGDDGKYSIKSNEDYMKGLSDGVHV